MFSRDLSSKISIEIFHTIILTNIFMVLTHKVPSKFIAEDILQYFFYIF